VPVAATARALARRNPGVAHLALCGLATLGIGLGCTEKGRSLVLVDLSSNLTIDHVSVVVAQASGRVGEADAHWVTTPQPLELGVYLPKTISGLVDVIACGFDASGATVAASPTDPASVTATVQPGIATAPVQITLVSGTSPALCATVGGSGGSGGGNGGAGAGGGNAGAGGASGPGAGGASGSGGPGGTSGSGGAGGTGGSGGTSGTGGAGGASGATGVGGGGASGAGGGGAGGTGGQIWRGAMGVGTDAAVDESFPSVAVDSAGNAVVVYEHGNDIWFSRYDAASNQWGTAAQLETQGGRASNPIVAVDKNGNYLAVWRQANDSTLEGVYQSTSSDGVSWSGFGTITTDNAFGPVMSMNANGAAIVAWTESTGSAYQAAASVRATTGGTWSAAQVLRPGDDYGDRNPAVAMSGMGQAFAGWEQDDDGATAENSIWMRQYTGTSWQAAALFETYNANIAYNVSLAANTAGDAIATYVEVSAADPATIQLWSRRYVPATGFASPLKVADQNDINTIVPPSLTLDESGVATVAWAAAAPTNFEVYTNRSASTDATWPTPMEMETDNVAQDTDAVTPIVRNDPTGNVTLIWRKSTTSGRFDLASRRFAAGAWGPATLLETNNGDSVDGPSLGVGASGTGVAAWYYDAALDVWASVFR
jgi:hypothetical protein